MASNRRLARWWLAGCLLASGCGTSDRLWPAAGRVTFADGRPVGGGTIDIKPLDASGRAARAAIGVDGHFRLETAGRRGVRAGRYRVAVRPQLVVGHPAHGPAVAPRHGAFDGSGIEFEVPRGGREDLVVTVEAAD